MNGASIGNHPGLAQRVAALESNIRNAAIAFQKNTNAFGQGFQVVDQQLHVHAKILNDLVNGGIQTIEEDGVKKVDFTSYARYYAQCMEFEAFMELMRRIMSRPSPEPVQSHHEQDAVVFGG